MKLIAKGRRGEIWLDEKTLIAIKKAKDQSKKAAINKEIQILKKLNNLGINFVPKIIEYGDGRFKYKRINGIHFQNYIKTLKLPEKKLILKKLLDKLLILDKIGIIHGEMIRPYKNIIVEINPIFYNINKVNNLNYPLDNKFNFINIKIIDFERGKLNDYSGKNMRSYAQFLKNENILTINDLKKLKGLHLENIYKFLKDKLI